MTERQYLVLTAVPGLLVAAGLVGALTGSAAAFAALWILSGVIDLAKSSLLWWDLVGARTVFYRRMERAKGVTISARQHAVLVALIGVVSIVVGTAVALGSR
jgi:hypothetical protein